MTILFNKKLLILLLLIHAISAWTQNYDVIIKDGQIIDPKNNISKNLDIAIKDGKIEKIESGIPEIQAKKVIYATNMIVVPGLIDIHTHNFAGTEPNSYISNSFTSLPPDGFTFRSGITTVVDVGSSGWKNFETFKKQTIDNSKTRVLSFLNIVGIGMKGGSYEQDLNDMDPGKAVAMAEKYKGTIVGFKLAHYSKNNWEPVHRVVEAGKQANIPVMIDFGGTTPELSLETLLMEKLRPGDIFTHMYAHVKGRTPVVDDNGKVRPYVFAAQKKGVLFDVGHGGGSFDFEQCIPAMEQGLLPNTLSTDLHTGSMNGGMKNLLNVMSKFLNMNLPLEELIETVTWNPAQYINRTDLGHLSIGAVADISIIRIEEGNFGFVDTKGFKVKGNKKLVCELTIKDGNVVWDLNGISRPFWKD